MLKATLASSLLNQQAQVAAAESAAARPSCRSRGARSVRRKLIPEIKVKVSRLQSAQLTEQSAIEQKRYVQAENSNRAQLASQEAKVAQLRDLYGLRQHQVESLKVRAGIPGVLQELPVQVGERVPAGTNLAKVARPELLKAELKIQETQAKDARLGLPVQVEGPPSSVVPGHIIRIAPSSRRHVDDGRVQLDGPLPDGARPEQAVDGTIRIERAEQQQPSPRLKPTSGQQNSQIEAFKVVEGDQAAFACAHSARAGFRSATDRGRQEVSAWGDEIVPCRHAAIRR